MSQDSPRATRPRPAEPSPSSPESSGAVPPGWTCGPVREVPDGTVGEWIAATAAARPDAVAVRQGDETLSYGQLLAAATRLARRLQELGVGPEVPVGICADRRPGLVTAFLAVLLSGGAFLPLDPELPAARIGGMLADADATVVLVDDTGRRRCPPDPLLLDIPPAGGEPPVPVTCPARGDNAAYLIYTSGSTGRPKGVVVEHRSLTTMLVGYGESTRAHADMRALAFSSISFDAMLAEFFLPLMLGAQLCLLGTADRTDPARLTRFLVEHQIDWAYLPPVLLPVLDPRALPQLRVVFCGGGPVGPEQVERWSTGGRRLHNSYGPTEATMCVSTFVAAGRWDEPVPIGRPLANQRLYVLDEDLRQVGVGERGELCVGGPCVARGYHGRPELTAAMFVPDPTVPGGRMYRTGDVVSWRPDGTLSFHGRRDRQVKVRGQRIEIGEVEAVLHALPGVDNAAVDVHGERLVAYLTPCQGPDEAAVRELCAHRLPSAAVPARVVRLARLPLTTARKVDLGALRAHLAGASTTREPRSELARAVAERWARSFGLDGPAGLDDDFFALGGHSLTAMRLVSLLHDELDRAVDVAEVFAARTLAGLVEVVERAPRAGTTGPTTGHPPALSAAQRRLWFVDQLAPDAGAYTITMAERLVGPLDVATLSAALRAVTERQEVLRWRIPQRHGSPYAVLGPVRDVDLAVEDISAAADRGAALAERLAAHAGVAFDLASGPLLRAWLIRLGEREHVLSLAVHHAVFDGVSTGPFYRDLSRAYDAARGCGPAPEPPPASFADYVAWRAEAEARRGAADLDWWIRHLDGAPTVLELPADRPRPAEQSYAGRLAGIELPASVDAAVRALAVRIGTTTSAVMLAALGQVLRRLTGRHDLVVGTPAADRRHPAFADLVGFFVDILPLRVRVDDDAGFTEAVRAAHEELVAVAAHPTAALERIVDALRLSRDPARAPLVQVLFNVFNFAEPRLRLSGLEVEPVPAGPPGSPFDLTVYVVERHGRLRLELVHNTDLFDADRIEALLAGYVTLLERFTAEPDRPARQVSMRPPGPVPTADRTVLDLAGRPAAVGEYGPIAVRDGAGYRPTTQHGRIDPDGTVTAVAAETRSRPAPPRPAPASWAPPSTDTEKLVAQVWRQVLNVPVSRVHDNFFDIGGDSMSLVTVRLRLQERLGRDIRVVDLFRYPNIRSLAAHLDQQQTDTVALDRAAARATARRGRVRRRPSSRSAGNAE